jgi:DNA-binding NarL/FixJ family response regulator
MNQPAGKNPLCIRLLIADRQPRARRALEALLTALRWSTPSRTRRPIEVVGETDDGEETIDQVQMLHPDVVVMDLYARTESFPGPNVDGLKAIRTIKCRWPAIRIVVLTLHAADRCAALSAGADAFLLKGCSTRELLEAVMPVAC